METGARSGSLRVPLAAGVVRRAAIDIGTNSVRLLVADVVPEEPPVVKALLRRQVITRLGEALGREGRIRPEAAARTAAAVQDILALAAESGVPRPTVVGTYALRVAPNPEELLARLPVSVRILSGEEEARLGFMGAAAAWEGPRDAPLLVVDIGGGSVELAWGRREEIEGSASLPVGCVLLTASFLANDPPQDHEVDALRLHVRQAVDAVLDRLPQRAYRCVGVGGTITTLAALAQRLSPYDPDRVHGFRLGRAQVDAVTAELLSLPLARRRRLPGLQPERADILPAGALVLQSLLHLVPCETVVASEADLLWALVLTP